MRVELLGVNEELAQKKRKKQFGVNKEQAQSRKEWNDWEYMKN